MIIDFKVRMRLFTSVWLLAACGKQVSQRNAIEDHTTSQRAESVGVSSPFHSYSGWKQVVSFHASDSASDAVVEACIQAASTWNDTIGRDVLGFAGTVTALRKSGLYSSLEDDLTIVYPVSDWHASTGKANTTLATTVWENATDSDRIVKGDVLLNTQEYIFVDALKVHTDSNNQLPVVDAQTVILHEFGHLLGLEHVSVEDDIDSIMHARTYVGAGVASRIPSAQDVTNIRSIYD